MPPVPPFVTLWNQTFKPGGPAATTAERDRITEEVLEAAFDDGSYQVRGTRVTTTGLAQLQAGELVTVAWRRGVPYRILAHQARRAQPVRLITGRTGGVVEELFFQEISATRDEFNDKISAKVDVYYRNDQQVTRLNLQDVISVDYFGTSNEFLRTGPVRVDWGQADNTFCVTSQYAVAERITGAATDDRVRIRARATGSTSVTIAYVVAGTNTALSVGVVGNAITVTVATDGAGSATSTASQVVAAINASTPAAALVAADIPQGDGSGVVAGLGASGLTDLLYAQRFFVFRLSREIATVGSANTITASFVRAISMPTFTLPAKFSRVDYIVGINEMSQPYLQYTVTNAVTFPYQPFTALVSGRVEGRAVLTPDLQIVYFLRLHASTLTDSDSGTGWGQYDDVDYLIGVRSDSATVLWESKVSDQYRRPDPLHPYSLFDETLNTEQDYYRVILRSWEVVDWSDADPTRRLIATFWERAVIHEHQILSVLNIGGDAARGAFVENGTGVHPHMIMPWTTWSTPVAPITYGASTRGSAAATWVNQTVTVGQALIYSMLVSASPHHVLWYSGAVISLAPTKNSDFLGVYSLDAGSLTHVADRTNQSDGELTLAYRAGSLRLLAPAFAYVVAEASTVAGWPPAAERGQFPIFTEGSNVVLDYNLMTTIAGDPALGAVGGLTAIPAGVTLPDGSTGARRYAVHVVNDAEILTPLGRYQAQ
jgi:hypothetical protein